MHVQTRGPQTRIELARREEQLVGQRERGSVERADLDRFLFDPDDIVVIVGQDGPAANVAKYLDGQPVIRIKPEAGSNPGVLVTDRPADVPDLLRGQASVERRTMVEASTDDGRACWPSTRSISATQPPDRSLPDHTAWAGVRAAGLVRPHCRHRDRLTGWCRSSAVVEYTAPSGSSAMPRSVV